MFEIAGFEMADKLEALEMLSETLKVRIMQRSNWRRC